MARLSKWRRFRKKKSSFDLLLGILKNGLRKDFLRPYFCRYLGVMVFTLIPSVSGYSTSVASNYPMIRNIGMVPFQWFGFKEKSQRLENLKEDSDQFFKRSVLDSERFRVINNEIIEELWSTPSGRQMLANQYELQGFISLSIVDQSDAILFDARILSSKMNNYFMESKRITKEDFLNFSKVNHKKFIQDLMFKLINRFPIDFHVTSIQGKYVTISSGKKQNVFEKDNFVLNRVISNNIHPATGSFTDFTLKPVGKIEIIESRNHSAIAKLISQTSVQSIRIGDGAKIPNLKTRISYQGSSEVKTLQSSPVVIRKKPVESDSPWFKNANKEKPKTPPVINKPKEKVSERQSSPKRTSEVIYRDRKIPINLSLGAFVFDFKVQGLSRTISDFPSFLVNNITLGSSRRIYGDWNSNYEAGLSFGSTKNKGSYTNLWFDADMLYHLDMLREKTILRSLHFGGFTGYETIGVSKESFGGLDILNLGGRLKLDFNTMSLTPLIKNESSISLDLSPIGFGDVGVLGTKKSISSHIMTKIKLTSMFIPTKYRNIKIGPELILNRQQFKIASRSANFNTTTLAVKVFARF